MADERVVTDKHAMTDNRVVTNASAARYRQVVLVKPPESSRFNFGTFSLGVLAAAIRDHAAVTILDATALGVEAAAAAVWARCPDLVGVTAKGLRSVVPVAAFIRQMRAAAGGGTAGDSAGKGGDDHGRPAAIIAGGHGASMAPDPLLEAGADAVVSGEGEETLREIVAGGIRAGTAGVACRLDGRTVTGPPRPPIQPLERLPLPARDLMPPPPDGVHLMETSRGCPHTCAFCETTRFYGRRWRPHPPARVAAEVRLLVESHGAWMIHFADDNFCASPRRVLEICRRLRRGPLPAFILASARGDDLLAEPRLIPAMAAARIQRVTVGVETLDPGAAARAAKPIPLPTYRAAFQRMAAHGVFSIASFIIGLPGESPAMRERAVELAVAAGPDAAHFLPFLPLPGTPMAAGRAGPDPDPADVRDAELCNVAFRRHPAVHARLAAAVAGGGVRGLLARATLEHFRGAGIDAPAGACAGGNARAHDGPSSGVEV